MTDTEIDSFVSTGGFGVLSLSDGSHAYGMPLFYGVRDGAIRVQTRDPQERRSLDAASEACLTISSARAMGQWASVQIVGRLERVEGISPKPVAYGAIVGALRPLVWVAGDAGDPGEDVSTFRLVPTRRTGRHSLPPQQVASERDIGF